jgi:hypothetical protein
MPDEPTPARPPRRWWRRLVVLAVLLGGLYLARAPLLRGLAGLLVVDEPDAGVPTLVLLDGDGMFDEAAQRYRTGQARRLLLFHGKPSRIERLGLIPPHVVRARKALRERGVPADALTVLPQAGRSYRQHFTVLGSWLEEHPEDDVYLLCNRFASRRVRRLVGRVLGSDAGRVHVLALPARRYTEADWWQHRDGQIDFVSQAVRLAFVVVCGEGTAQGNDWDPDDYEASLR